MILLRKCLLLSLILFSVMLVHAQGIAQIDSSQISLPAQHYLPEFDLDQATNPEAWKHVTAGFHAAFGSEDILYFRKEVPSIDNEKAGWEATCWKGERINTQVVLWSTDTVQQIRFTVDDFRNDKGKLLSKVNADVNKVCYVLSNYPYNAPNADCGTAPGSNAWLMPDRFEKFDRFDLPANSVRPVWISIDVPVNSEPGIYKGRILIESTKERVVLNIQLRVQNQILPKPHDWDFRLDLWQNPWVIADYYHVKPWSAEHKELLKQHLKLYADAGGKYITTYGVHSPWGDNEYYIEGGMIQWIKSRNGSWTFDYNIFDQYVELAMSVGIDKAITIYTPLPWGERFRYMDEASGNYKYEQWLPTTEVYRKIWDIFLTDLMKHLQSKGWFSKTFLGVNENAMDQTLAAIKVIKEHSKLWKITYAGDWHKELDTLLDDYSSVYGKEPVVNEVQNRSLQHRTSSFYICCTPPKPNTFLFSPPIEGRWLGWYARAHHYDGFLRWAYDSWTADPLRDARYIYWPAGDCFLVYPGANSCIRFEKLREGIVDFEKLRILTHLAMNSSNDRVRNLLDSLNKHLQSFNAEKDFDESKLKKDIDKGRKMIEDLSDILNHG